MTAKCVDTFLPDYFVFFIAFLFFIICLSSRNCQFNPLFVDADSCFFFLSKQSSAKMTKVAVPRFYFFYLAKICFVVSLEFWCYLLCCHHKRLLYPFESVLRSRFFSCVCFVAVCHCMATRKLKLKLILHTLALLTMSFHCLFNVKLLLLLFYCLDFFLN